MSGFGPLLPTLESWWLWEVGLAVEESRKLRRDVSWLDSHWLWQLGTPLSDMLMSNPHKVHTSPPDQFVTCHTVLRELREGRGISTNKLACCLSTNIYIYIYIHLLLTIHYTFTCYYTLHIQYTIDSICVYAVDILYMCVCVCACVCVQHKRFGVFSILFEFTKTLKRPCVRFVYSIKGTCPLTRGAHISAVV